MTADNLFEGPGPGAPKWGFTPELRHFEPVEFNGWANRMSPRLAYTLDLWRERCGFPIEVSPHPRAIGRTNGNENSRHYAVGRAPDAIDVFPRGDIEIAVKTAVQLFGGVGLYVNWTDAAGRKTPGMHVDTRPRINDKPASWGQIDGKTVSLVRAMVALGLPTV